MLLSAFITSFLERCCGTLESLTIKGSNLKAEPFLGRENMAFPCLRYLDLAYTNSSPDPIAWSSLLAAPLKHLSLPMNGLNTNQYMSAPPIIQSLETLVVPSLSIDIELVELVVNFISLHSHVHKLSIRNGTPQLLDQHIIPFLTNGKWTNFTSLSLSWQANIKSDQIAAESLAAINSIRSLEQLYLSVGESARWRHRWLPDHNEMRSRLGGLENLKKLAFSRDTYKIPGDNYGFEEEGDEDDSNSGSDINNLISNGKSWERVHRNRMLWEAEQYAALYPKLNWVFCGQLAMSIQTKEGLEGTIREATPLSRERNPRWRHLAQIFEMKGDN